MLSDYISIVTHFIVSEPLPILLLLHIWVSQRIYIQILNVLPSEFKRLHVEFNLHRVDPTRNMQLICTELILQRKETHFLNVMSLVGVPPPKEGSTLCFLIVLWGFFFRFA